MESLADRMKTLEDLLRKQGLQQPTADRNLKSNGSNEQNQLKGTAQRTPPSTTENSEAVETGFAPDAHIVPTESVTFESDEMQHPRVQSVCSSGSPLSTASSDGILAHILSTQGHWTYDDLTGRLRYFGPTTNFHIYSAMSTWPRSLECRDQERYGLFALRDIPQQTQDYLLDLYWTYYNSVLFVVHKEAFLNDMRQRQNTHYSAFLHLTLLAMGMRFADTSLPLVSDLLGSGKETKIQREARRLVDFELSSPGGLPSIQALLILGDLENATGRDSSGWMYSGECIPRSRIAT